MRTSLLMQTLIVMFALEWELCSQDPVVFCYRIGVSLRMSSSEDSVCADNSVSDADYTCLP
jgi:hypothetical protein